MPVNFEPHIVVLPGNKLMMKEERFEILMSLFPPGIPKNACQIHKDWSAIASKIIKQKLSLPWNCLYHATGQFFQVQCIQPNEANILGKPRAVFMKICFSKSSRDGCHKKVALKQPRIATTKCWRAKLEVLAPVLQYSSVVFEEIP
jgi:hypothetical protein